MSLGAFLGYRVNMGEKDYIGLGGNFGMTSGDLVTVTGVNTMAFGPYVSFEHYLSNNFLMTAYISPYQYSGTKNDLVTTRTATSSIFTSGGVAVAWLF